MGGSRLCITRRPPRRALSVLLALGALKRQVTQATADPCAADDVAVSSPPAAPDAPAAEPRAASHDILAAEPMAENKGADDRVTYLPPTALTDEESAFDQPQAFEAAEGWPISAVGVADGEEFAAETPAAAPPEA